MSMPLKTTTQAVASQRLTVRRMELEEEAISPHRLQQIENATVVMATALSSSVVFYAVLQYMT